MQVSLTVQSPCPFIVAKCEHREAKNKLNTTTFFFNLIYLNLNIGNTS